MRPRQLISEVLALDSSPPSSLYGDTVDAFGRKAPGATRAPHFTSNFRFRRLRRRNPAPTAPTLPLAALRVLLVEDHHSTRKALAQLLTQRGYSVSEAESTAQARTLAKAKDFDIVVCDLGLPDGLGYDLMREFKKEFSLPGIALSGYGMESDIQQSFEAGFSAHLTKPVELATLEEAIERTIYVA
jgi:CheY-like chemotaxis protein